MTLTRYQVNLPNILDYFIQQFTIAVNNFKLTSIHVYAYYPFSFKGELNKLPWKFRRRDCHSRLRLLNRPNHRKVFGKQGGPADFTVLLRFHKRQRLNQVPEVE